MKKRTIMNTVVGGAGGYLGRILMRKLSSRYVNMGTELFINTFFLEFRCNNSDLITLFNDHRCVRLISDRFSRSVMLQSPHGLIADKDRPNWIILNGAPCYVQKALERGDFNKLLVPKSKRKLVENLFSEIFRPKKPDVFPTEIKRIRVLGEGNFTWTALERKKKFVLDDIPIHSNTMKTLKDQIARMREEWSYKENLNYSRNILLYGPKGTGKSHITIAMANELRVNTFVFPVVNTSDQFSDTIRRIISRPAIVVADEVESLPVFCPGYHPTENSGLSTRDILDYFSGIGAPEGIMNLVCTNDPSKLDDRLRRKGRFKEEIHIGPVDSDGIKYWLAKNHSYIVPDAVRLRPTTCADIFDLMDTLDDPEAFVRHLAIRPRSRKKCVPTDNK